MSGASAFTLSELLDDLELALKAAGLWSVQSPAAEAFASQQPFCVDTLSFPEWLQFIFLQRMRVLLANSRALPGRSGILPMAEQTLSFDLAKHQPVLDILCQIDEGLEMGVFG